MRCPRCNASVNHATLCDKCRVAYGDKLCQCGAVIHRDDRMCRSCWTSIAHHKPMRMRTTDKGEKQDDAPAVDLNTYRMETTQVESASIEHDGDWSHLLSPEAKAGLEAWRARGKHGEAQS